MQYQKMYRALFLQEHSSPSHQAGISAIVEKILERAQGLAVPRPLDH